MITPHRLQLRCAATLAATTATIVALWSVPLPPLDWSPVAALDGDGATDLATWATTVLRSAVTVVLAYLWVSAAVNLVLSALTIRARLPRAVDWSSRLAPRWLAAASASVAVTALWGPTAGAVALEDPSGAVVMEVVEDPPTRATTPAPRTMLPWASTTTLAPSPTTQPLPEPPRLAPSARTAEGAPSSGSSSGAVSEEQLPPPLVIERARPDDIAEHTVRPGDHFWSIAEQVVAARGLDVPVDRYWRLLVEANRSRLVDPANPDLLFPGQVLVLP